MLTVSKNVLPTVSKLFENDWNSMLNWDNHRFSSRNGAFPPANIKETGEAFYVEMMLPGMSKEDIQLEIAQNRLTVKAEKKSSSEAQNGEKYTHREFSYQSYERSFNLNHNLIDSNGIEAKYENGMLSLSLPKKEEVKEKPPRLIEIS